MQIQCKDVKVNKTRLCLQSIVNSVDKRNYPSLKELLLQTKELLKQVIIKLNGDKLLPT